MDAQVGGRGLLGRRSAWFLVLVGVWTWAIWPNFLRNIWADERSWSSGPTSFFLVHLVLVVGSLAIGTGVAVIGVRGLRSMRRSGAPREDLSGSRAAG